MSALLSTSDRVRSRTSGRAGEVRRSAIAAAVIAGYIALGYAFRLPADVYLLVGIPITLAFQALVARRPLQAMWLRTVPAFAFTRASTAAVVAIGVAPGIMAVSGVMAGNPVRAVYGAVGIVGAVGAVYCLRAIDRRGLRETLRATAVGSAAMITVMVAYRLATGGFHGDLSGALVAVVVSFATYLPAVFVIEEVLFRGVIDAYLAPGTEPRRRSASIVGSALWGVWHLPVMGVGLGVLTVPYLVVMHVLVGWALVRAWRRTGNLAAPGLAHAAIDALRNGVAVL